MWCGTSAASLDFWARATRPSPCPRPGDTVRITDGALESFLGTVEEIDLDRSKVRVVVSMFGRETPVELELDQVEPAND